MSDALAIVQEQLAYWLEENFTPSEALMALGYPLDARASGITVIVAGQRRPSSWGAVLDAALAAYSSIAAGYAPAAPIRRRA